jgi:Transposase DDE domain
MENFIINALSEHLKGTQIVSNLSRQKMLVMTLCSLLKSRSVVLSDLAVNLNDSVKTESNETRLRDFFREVEFDYTALATFIFSFLAAQPGQKIRLTIDRTNWKFGSHATNILMITASKGVYNIPFFWELLDNEGGNSNCEQRIELLQKCVDVLGAQRIGLVVGDREFIGQIWLKFLKIKKIPFCVRVPKHHIIETTDGQQHVAETIWKKRQQTVRFKHCMVDGVWGSAVVTTDAKGDLLYLFGTANVEYLEQFYKKRWTIETIFQAFKSRGFNLEDTHLKINERLKKLIGIVSMGYAFCCALGIFRHENERAIKNKKHKRKTKSFFRYGLDFIKDGFKVAYKYQAQWLTIFKAFIKFIFTNNSLSSS